MPTDPDSAPALGAQAPAGARPLRDAHWARKVNMRLALSLFALYSVIYAAFVITSAFFPQAMEIRPWGGLNLAILWGFALIVAAILMALIYGLFSRTASEGPAK